MFFILQKNDNFKTLDIELEVLKQELNKQRFCHEYTIESIDSFDEIKNNSSFDIKKAIPVGSIDFVARYLQKVHNITHMSPIEVPNILRTDEFLGRKYSIVESNQIPQTGYFFIKDVSELKVFTYIGDMTNFHFEMFEEKVNSLFNCELKLNPNHLFQVSEVVKILSEYRVFVFNDNIERIQFYDGVSTVMPTPEEIKKLQKMVLKYMLDNSRPKAYALDIAIIEKEQGRDLIVLESCPFISLGTYGFVGSNLPYMYQAGLDWYITCNESVKKFSNFKNLKSGSIL